MKKIILALAFLLAGAANAFAQSTTVSGQVTDTGSQTWNNAQYTFQFVPNPQFPVGPYTWTGGTLNSAITGTTGGTGAYSQSVPDNATISPVGSKWILQVCPNATSPCFSTPATSITGATQTVNATPPAIAINLTNPPGSTTRAYTDAEIIGAVIGSQYYNVTSAAVRVCQAVTGQACTTWANVSAGGGSGLPCVTTALSLQYNNAGAFGCLLYTYNAGTNTITAAGSSPMISLHSTATSPVGSLGFANGINLSGAENSGAVAIFQTTGFSPTVKLASGSASLGIIVGNSGTGRCDFASGGVGTADCAVGSFNVAQDTPADAVNGQDLVAVEGLVGLNGAGTKTIRNAVDFRATGPANNLGVCCPAPEHATNIYGFEVADLGFLGTSNSEMAGVKIHSLSAPSAGTKFSIKADVGSGLASFGDSASLGGVGSNGVLGLLGTTSGTATFTAPAVAGTTTNDVVSSNGLTAPQFLMTATSGLIPSGGTNSIIEAGGSNTLLITTVGIQSQGSGADIGLGGSGDTFLSRNTADIVAVGSAPQVNDGKFQAAAYFSTGTKYTTDAGCGTVTTTLGGASAGSYHSNTTGTCTVVITMGNTSTATNGWACTANDLTTPADVIHETVTTTTTATLSGTTVTGDVINFHCTGY